MADTDTAVPETVASEPLKNDASPATAPQDNSAELERLRKEVQEARMYKNEAEKLRAEKAENERKKLEEDGKYKEALEVERAEKQKLLDERDATERNALLSKETDEILSKYSSAIVEIAKTAGLSLVDDSDDAKVDLSKKLDDIAAKVGGSNRVEANNPSVSTPQPENKEALIGAMSDASLRSRDRDAAGLKFISNLDSLKVLRENAGLTPPSQ